MGRMADSPILATVPLGPAFVTVFVNGIPSASTFLLGPDLIVEQPAGSGLAAGGTQSYITPSGTPASLTYTVRNDGGSYLTGLAITIDGANAGDFSVTASPMSPVAAAGTTAFTVQFAPATGGAATLVETAALHMGNNVAGKTPLTINLSGTALSTTLSTTGDGMSDAAKYLLAPLGCDWRVSQPALVSTYYSTTSAAGLYTAAQQATAFTDGQNDVLAAPDAYGLYALSQVQSLQVAAPTLTKDPVTGKFKLAVALGKAATGSLPFATLPFTAPGTVLNGQGQVEFTFTVPDIATVFRVQSH